MSKIELKVVVTSYLDSISRKNANFILSLLVENIYI